MLDSSVLEVHPSLDDVPVIMEKWDCASRVSLGRLWSLWDIMKKFQPEALAALTMLLQIIQDDQRLVVMIDRTHAAYHPLLSVAGITEPITMGGASGSDEPPVYLRDAIVKFHQICLDAGLSTSATTIEKIARLGSNEKWTTKELAPLAVELHGRLHDELTKAEFLSLTPRESEYYAQPREGWSEIISRFPEVGDDVEEAYKCFALSRYPAAVFHSVQVLEVGLIDLGTFIGVNDPTSGWSAVEKRLKKVLSTEYRDRTTFEKQNYEFLEQVHGTTEGLKNAWRNKVSHAQGRLALMTANYSPEIAEEILFASRAFMRRLADGLPQRPVPTPK